MAKLTYYRNSQNPANPFFNQKIKINKNNKLKIPYKKGFLKTKILFAFCQCSAPVKTKNGFAQHKNLVYY
jgi:hypothetical protein